MSEHTKEPFAWISTESIYRLKEGGNRRGTVPIHHKESNTATVPIYRKSALDKIAKQRDELLEALKKMNRAYVNLMENGRDRIIQLGGDCDPIELMERDDPNLKESREAIASVEGGA